MMVKKIMKLYINHIKSCQHEPHSTNIKDIYPRSKGQWLKFTKFQYIELNLKGKEKEHLRKCTII